MNKPTVSMIAAVRAVAPQERLAAAKLAEVTFFAAIARFTMFGDFDAATNREMAGDMAAAEVSFHFA
jgi:hypothetical protein